MYYVQERVIILFFYTDCVYRDWIVFDGNKSVLVGNSRSMEYHRIRLCTSGRTLSNCPMAIDAGLSGTHHAAFCRGTTERYMVVATRTTYSAVEDSSK